MWVAGLGECRIPSWWGAVKRKQRKEATCLGSGGGEGRGVPKKKVRSGVAFAPSLRSGVLVPLSCGWGS